MNVMKKELFICDRCKAKMSDYTIRIVPTWLTIDGQNKGAVFDNTAERNYCPDCAEEICTFMMTGKRKARELDEGKIVALRKAGWTLSKIADEMRVSTPTIISRLKKYHMK